MDVIPFSALLESVSSKMYMFDILNRGWVLISLPRQEEEGFQGRVRPRSLASPAGAPRVLSLPWSSRSSSSNSNVKTPCWPPSVQAQILQRRCRDERYSRLLPSTSQFPKRFIFFYFWGQSSISIDQHSMLVVAYMSLVGLQRSCWRERWMNKISKSKKVIQIAKKNSSGTEQPHDNVLDIAFS